MPPFILALDQGTTSSRAIVFGRDGRIVASAQQEFAQLLPHPGHVEHDPEAIWNTQLATARDALAKAQLTAGEIAAIGVTNQRETTILWDRATGKPVANAIVWQSRASAAICEQLKQNGLEATFREKTGLVVDPYFSGTKIKYLLDRDDELRLRGEKGEVLFGTVDSFLMWRLTGGRCHITDASNASRTLLYNIHTRQWDDELLGILDIPRRMLPEVLPSSHIYGQTDPQWFGASIPIAGDAGDQQAALFGQACHQPGMAKNTYGTGCFLLMNTGGEAVTSRNKLLTTVAWNLRGPMQYALEGSVFIGGAVVQWLRDGLGHIQSAAEIEALAASVPDAGGVILVPAFAGLGAPHWDAYARGSVFGLTRGTTKAHLARAALDAIALQSAEVLDAMQADSGITLTELRVDGGAAANNLLMQIQADLLGVPVVRPKVLETTALGAAYLAGLATGYWSAPSDIGANWQVDRRFEPAMSRDQAQSLRARWEKGVARAKDWEDHA
jgi:glycerol kinase